MNASPYHPHPGNAATFTDDSNGWETAPPRPRLTLARIAQLHARAQSDAAIHERLPIHTYGQHVSVQEDDIYALEFFKARIRLTHPAEPASGPAATLATLEPLAPKLAEGTAIYAAPAVAVCVNKTRLLASANPPAEIKAAIGWLRAFALTTLPSKPDTTQPTNPTPPAQP